MKETKILLSKRAEKDLKKIKDLTFWKRYKPTLEKIKERPFTAGHPLHGILKGAFSCEVTKKFRIIYTVEDGKIRIITILAIGHHDDVY